MIAQFLETSWMTGLLCAALWGLTFLLAVRRPHLYLNSLLLTLSLMTTVLFASSLFTGEARKSFLLVCFWILSLLLLMIPVLLIISGIQILRRESVCLRHFLSLALGIVIGVGEVAAVLYVLHLWGTIHLGVAGPWLQFFVLTVLYCSFLLLSFILYFIFLQFLPHTMRFNYVIIHGCGLSGGERLTRLLRDRVEKAIEIYNRCEIKPVIIPSGGQGKDEKISEARAMQDYLLSRGIPAEHVIPEDRSASTAENLRFSKAIIDARGGEKRIALVSSGFHIYRCLRIAHQQGMKCTGFGSYTALYFLPSALIREFVAIFLNKTFLVWALLGYCCFLTPFLMAAFR